MAKKPRVFSKVNGWDEKTLFEYSKRHLVAAGILFQNQEIATYILSVFSGGYLCHLGIELLLKGCWLFESGSFEDEHNLHKLTEKINFLNLSDRLRVFLSNIELFNEMRYPQDLTDVKVVQYSDINANLPEEIGDHDWVGTIELLYEIQNQMPDDLQKIARPLWHGNVAKALELIEDCYSICMDDDLKYKNKNKLFRYLDELNTYIENNQHLIPNYGERWRYGEAISTGFVESTINEVIAKRMVKKQQMQWTQEGAHYMLQTRTAVLNNELQDDFSRWYPGICIGHSKKHEVLKMKKAA